MNASEILGTAAALAEARAIAAVNDLGYVAIRREHYDALMAHSPLAFARDYAFTGDAFAPVSIESDATPDARDEMVGDLLLAVLAAIADVLEDARDHGNGVTVKRNIPAVRAALDEFRAALPSQGRPTP